jgi:two-component system nitrogen regulation response regulator GlnG
LLENAVLAWMENDGGRAAAENGQLHQSLVTIVERVAIEALLTQTGGNQLRAAALLGINRNTLRLKRGKE